MGEDNIYGTLIVQMHNFYNGGPTHDVENVYVLRGHFMKMSIKEHMQNATIETQGEPRAKLNEPLGFIDLTVILPFLVGCAGFVWDLLLSLRHLLHLKHICCPFNGLYYAYIHIFCSSSEAWHKHHRP